MKPRRSLVKQQMKLNKYNFLTRTCQRRLRGYR